MGLRLALREIRLLRSLDHPLVIRLERAFRSRSQRVYAVFPHIDGGCAQRLLQKKYVFGLPPALLKSFAWQLCVVVRYLHEQQVLHRDIKPPNVLCASDGTIRLCDFGFARRLGSADPRDGAQGQLTAYVVTRAYRAPEVLLGQPYGAPADVWALGATLAELAVGRPLLPGTSSLDQLWHVLGAVPGPRPAPIAAAVEALAKLNPATLNGAVDPQLLRPRALPGRPLRERLGRAEAAFVDVVEACMRLEPADRASADQLLRMPYFADVRQAFGGHPTLERLYDELYGGKDETPAPASCGISSPIPPITPPAGGSAAAGASAFATASATLIAVEGPENASTEAADGAAIAGAGINAAPTSSPSPSLAPKRAATACGADHRPSSHVGLAAVLCRGGGGGGGSSNAAGDGPAAGWAQPADFLPPPVDGLHVSCLGGRSISQPLLVGDLPTDAAASYADGAGALPHAAAQGMTPTDSAARRERQAPAAEVQPPAVPAPPPPPPPASAPPASAPPAARAAAVADVSRPRASASALLSAPSAEPGSLRPAHRSIPVGLRRTDASAAAAAAPAGGAGPKDGGGGRVGSREAHSAPSPGMRRVATYGTLDDPNMVLRQQQQQQQPHPQQQQLSQRKPSHKRLCAAPSGTAAAACAQAPSVPPVARCALTSAFSATAAHKDIAARSPVSSATRRLLTASQPAAATSGPQQHLRSGSHQQQWLARANSSLSRCSSRASLVEQYHRAGGLSRMGTLMELPTPLGFAAADPGPGAERPPHRRAADRQASAADPFGLGGLLGTMGSDQDLGNDEMGRAGADASHLRSTREWLDADEDEGGGYGGGVAAEVAEAEAEAPSRLGPGEAFPASAAAAARLLLQNQGDGGDAGGGDISPVLPAGSGDGGVCFMQTAPAEMPPRPPRSHPPAAGRWRGTMLGYVSMTSSSAPPSLEARSSVRSDRDRGSAASQPHMVTTLPVPSGAATEALAAFISERPSMTNAADTADGTAAAAVVSGPGAEGGGGLAAWQALAERFFPPAPDGVCATAAARPAAATAAAGGQRLSASGGGGGVGPSRGGSSRLLLGPVAEEPSLRPAAASAVQQPEQPPSPLSPTAYDQQQPYCTAQTAGSDLCDAEDWRLELIMPPTPKAAAVRGYGKAEAAAPGPVGRSILARATRSLAQLFACAHGDTH
ncbi:hypothetical protein HYH03_012898 [Edaphochlamys debaryana]|uniref:Protein kinase domain-containing protein n=1 Tax=Edaphochlamys debaryana TaxID=47281 RepID=A0A835XRT0_9CHLO|nr:hypothetical protein HYH03_012898 [Edaphochlamys debaryana]|eukprot:KAG2488579.1 hypothetical protein HYH03_012898 [Edaphochlamys debaryana]